MTDLSLVTRLRATAIELARPGTKGYAIALREAADALTLQDEALASWSVLQDKWYDERQALKAKLIALEAERDELKDMVMFLSGFAMADWQKLGAKATMRLCEVCERYGVTSQIMLAIKEQAAKQMA